MKRFIFVLVLSGLAAFGFWSNRVVTQVSEAAPVGLTSTPALVTPTELPTEFLTNTPAPTASPVPVLPTATPTPQPKTPNNSSSSDPLPTALPALGVGASGANDVDITSPITRIVIPAVRLDTHVIRISLVQGSWNIAFLGARAGWLETSAVPGAPGNIVLVGHLDLVDGPGAFLNLFRLHPGDEIRLYSKQEILRYYVSTVQVTEVNDLSIMDPSDRQRLTLLTCDEGSWDPITRTYLRRLVVTADSVRVEPDSQNNAR